MVFSLAEMFRLWFLVLFSIFLVLFPLLCQAVLVFVRLWSLVLFSIFLVLLFRLYQAIVCGLVSSVVLLYVALSGCGLWSCSLSVLSGGVVLWS